MIDIRKEGNHVMIGDVLYLELPSILAIGMAPKGAKAIVIKFPPASNIDEKVIPFTELTVSGVAPSTPQVAISSLAALFPKAGSGGTVNIPDNLAEVAISGSYNDLQNKPTIPVLPNLSDVAISGNYNDLQNKPTIPGLPNLSDVALSGSYTDLQNKPTIPAPPDLTPYVTASGPVALTAKVIDATQNDISNLSKDDFAADQLEVFDPSTGTGSLASAALVDNVALRDLSFYDGFDRADTVSNSGLGILGTSSSGSAYDILSYHESGASQSAIVANKWVSKVTDTPTDVAYTVIQNTGALVSNIGAKIRWTDGGSSIADADFILTAGPDGSTNFEYNCLHVRVSRNAIILDIKVNGVFTGASRTNIFPTGFPRNKDIYIDIKFIGTTMYYNVGQFSGKIEEPLIATQGGTYAAWQIYFNPTAGVTGVSISSLWVGAPDYAGLDKDSAPAGTTTFSSNTTPAPVTGTLVKSALFTTNIPANTIGVNGYLKLEWLVAMTNNANAKTFTIEVGGVEIMYLSTSGVAGFQGMTRLAAKNSLIVNVGAHPSNNYNASTPATPIVYDASNSRQINWAVSNNLVFYVTLDVDTDTASLNSVQMFTYK